MTIFRPGDWNRIETAGKEWRTARWGDGEFDLPPNDRNQFTPPPA